MHARSRADVADIVGIEHGFVVVLDNHKGVAEIAELFKCGDELCIIPFMQTDTGLVENIEHTLKRGTDLGCKADSLAFSARKGARRTGKCQITQSHVLQKTETVFNFLQYEISYH